NYCTINGIHLRDAQSEFVVQKLMYFLFDHKKENQQKGDKQEKEEGYLMEEEYNNGVKTDLINFNFKLRDSIQDAVQEKNKLWFQRYRTTDGYSLYGA